MNPLDYDFLGFCVECKAYHLVGTNFFYDMEDDWIQTVPDCDHHNPCCCPCDLTNPDRPMLVPLSVYTFEQVLDSVPIAIQEELLFHLDLFA